MSRKELNSLLSVPTAGAEVPRPAFSVAGLFSYLMTKRDYYVFDIHAVCRKGDYKALEHFVSTHRDPTLLKRMANRLDLVNRPPLYEIIMFVDEDSITSAHYACAQLLLTLGSNPNFFREDDPCDTLLRATIVHSTVEMAALLIKYGASTVGLKGLGGWLLASKPGWAKKITDASRLSEAALDFITEVEAGEELEAHHTESKKDR